MEERQKVHRVGDRQENAAWFEIFFQISFSRVFFFTPYYIALIKF
jgi:hypothetical protein